MSDVETLEDEIQRLRLERNQFHAALRRQRTATIEECARAARKWAQADPEFRDCWPNDSIDAAIRALKDKS